MRGKIAVLVLVILTIAILIFGYWFLFVQSPIDQRFKLNPTPIPKNINADYLLPAAVGDFIRQSTSPVQAQPDGSLAGMATYADTDGKHITVEVRTGQLHKTPAETLQALYQPILSQYPGATPVIHADAPFPYGFLTVSFPASNGTPASTYSDFSWINGEWVIQVSTRETDAESLLQFVNIYVY